MSAELIFFFVLALGILVSSLLVVLYRNPMNSAVALVVTFLQMAGLYALLNAAFLAIIQVMVYAGAIMVLFLFVIMLLNLSDEELGTRKISVTKFVAGLATLGMFLGFVAAILTLQDRVPVQVGAGLADKTLEVALLESDPTLDADAVGALLRQGVVVDGLVVSEGARVMKEGEMIEFSSTHFPGLRRHTQVPGHEELRRLHMTDEELKEAELVALSPLARRELEARVAKWDRFGSVEAVGSLLYTKWLFPFELVALLLLAAIPGSVMLAKRRL